MKQLPCKKKTSSLNYSFPFTSFRLLPFSSITYVLSSCPLRLLRILSLYSFLSAFCSLFSSSVRPVSLDFLASRLSLSIFSLSVFGTSEIIFKEYQRSDGVSDGQNSNKLYYNNTPNYRKNQDTFQFLVKVYIDEIANFQYIRKT